MNVNDVENANKYQIQFEYDEESPVQIRRSQKRCKMYSTIMYVIVCPIGDIPKSRKNRDKRQHFAVLTLPEETVLGHSLLVIVNPCC